MSPANANTDTTLIPTFDLQKHHSKVEVPSDFDLRDLSKKYAIFPLKIIIMNGRRRLLLAMRNPLDQKAILDAEFRCGMSVVAVQADDRDISWLQQVHYYGKKISPLPTSEELPEITFDVFEQVSLISELSDFEGKKK